MTMLRMRAWRKPKYALGEMLYLNGFRQCGDGLRERQVYVLYVATGSPCTCEPSEVEFMHSTGCLDKNKKEIWEGDILQFQSGRIIKVEWKSSGFGYFVDSERQIWVAFSEGRVEQQIISESMVLGNIYEHPQRMLGS